MKERPILFSAPMVRAILAGLKTQTRRAMRTQPSEDFRVLAVEWYSPETVDHWGESQPGKDIFGVYGDEEGYKCPYGAPGDRLWVRETWAAQHRFDGYKPGHIPAGSRLHYMASFEGPCGLLKRPSIFMPRWASRVTLEVTGIRVEQLHAITLEDAQAEGVKSKGEYALLWDAINGEGAYMDDPWVWVVEFKPMPAPEEF